MPIARAPGIPRPSPTPALGRVALAEHMDSPWALGCRLSSFFCPRPNLNSRGLDPCEDQPARSGYALPGSDSEIRAQTRSTEMLNPKSLPDSTSPCNSGVSRRAGNESAVRTRDAEPVRHLRELGPAPHYLSAKHRGSPRGRTLRALTQPPRALPILRAGMSITRSVGRPPLWGEKPMRRANGWRGYRGHHRPPPWSLAPYDPVHVVGSPPSHVAPEMAEAARRQRPRC